MQTAPPNRLDTLIAKTESKLGQPLTLLLLIATITATCLFLAYPAEIITALFGQLSRTSPNDRFTNSYLPLTYNPWNLHLDPYWDQTRFRILGPLIAYYTHLRGRPSVLVSPLANPLIYCISYIYLRKRTQPSTAFLATLLLSLTLACLTSQTWAGFQDSLGSLFLLLAMTISSAPVSAACVFIGMLAHERILAAAFLLLFWHEWMNEPLADRLKRTATRSAWLLLAAALWALFVIIFKHHLNIDLAMAKRDAVSDVRTYETSIWPGWYYALRGGWIPPAALIALSICSRKFQTPALIGLAIAPILAMSLVSGDISRGASVAFPAIFIAILLLYRTRPALTNHLLFAAVLLQILSPIYTVVGPGFRPLFPLPLALFIQYFGHSAAH